MLALHSLRRGVQQLGYLALRAAASQEQAQWRSCLQPATVCACAASTSGRGFAALPAQEAADAGPPGIEMPLWNWRREALGSCTLPGDIFNVPVRRDILQRVVRWQLAKRQQGTHKTKGRGEVRGGGRKPFPQKGTGRARQGSIRAPQIRGGGVVFGPVVRSHAHGLQKKVRRLGLKCALSAKASEGRLHLLDTLALEAGKTRQLDKHLDVLLADEPRRSVLFIDSSKVGADGGEHLRLAANNLPWVDVLPAEGANVYSILQRDQLVLSRPALDALVARLHTPVRR